MKTVIRTIDDLEKIISFLYSRVPKGSKKIRYEEYILGGYLNILKPSIPKSYFPFTISELSGKDDPPDFVVKFSNGIKYGVEVTIATKTKYEKEKAEKVNNVKGEISYDVDRDGFITTYKKGESFYGNGYSGNAPEKITADLLRETITKKSNKIGGRDHSENHLVIYPHFPVPYPDPDMVMKYLREHLSKVEFRDRYNKIFIVRDKGNRQYNFFLNQSYIPVTIKEAF